MSSARNEPESVEEPAHPRPRLAWLAPLLLAIGVGTVYLLTLHPGVADKDAAEMQYMAPLLGVCHPPGYSYQVIAGWLFARLPLGSDIAWRMNLMVATCGVLGVLALYGAVRRITGQIVPAVLAALTLGFSSVYWMHALSPEVYVFYGMLLLAAVYCAVRFAESDRGLWFYLMAALLGVMLANRPSELFVLPGFVLLWPAFRRQVRIGWRRLALLVPLVVLPFFGALGFHLLRERPEAAHAMDDAIRDELVGEAPPVELAGSARLAAAFQYVSGTKWLEEASGKQRNIGWNLNKYAWMLSGAGGFGDRYEPDDWANVLNMMAQGVGSSVTALGGLLALWGALAWRRQWGWVALGLALFLGNGAFYLFHTAPDNLDFTLPGVAGLCLLYGLGAAKLPRAAALRWPCLALCAVAPLFLLTTNFARLNRDTPFEERRQEALAAAAAREYEGKVALLAGYEEAMTLRYLFRVKSPRGERVLVINNRNRYTGAQKNALLAGLQQRGYTVYLHVYEVPPNMGRRQLIELQQLTPLELATIGMVRVP